MKRSRAAGRGARIEGHASRLQGSCGLGEGGGRLATIAIGTKRPIVGVGVGVGVGIPPLRHNEGSPKKYANRGSHCAGGNYACVCVGGCVCARKGVYVHVCVRVCVFASQVKQFTK